ncbi:MAG: hypothetical protein ACK5F7_20455 [Planctomycetaceae bacterium]|jgi:hypothetical protein
MSSHNKRRRRSPAQSEMPFAEENMHFYAEEVGPPPEHQDFRTAPPVIFSGGRKPFKLLYGELTIYGTSGNDELQLIHYTKYFGFDPSGEDDITKLVLNGRTYFFTDTSVRTIRISLGGGDNVVSLYGYTDYRLEDLTISTGPGRLNRIYTTKCKFQNLEINSDGASENQVSLGQTDCSGKAVVLTGRRMLSPQDGIWSSMPSSDKVDFIESRFADLVVRTGAGNDKVRLNGTQAVHVDISLGPGDDVIEIRGSALGAGTVDGGSGKDHLTRMNSAIWGTIFNNFETTEEIV